MHKCCVIQPLIHTAFTRPTKQPAHLFVSSTLMETSPPASCSCGFSASGAASPGAGAGPGAPARPAPGLSSSAAEAPTTPPARGASAMRALPLRPGFAPGCSSSVSLRFFSPAGAASWPSLCSALTAGRSSSGSLRFLSAGGASAPPLRSALASGRSSAGSFRFLSLADAASPPSLRASSPERPHSPDAQHAGPKRGAVGDAPTVVLIEVVELVVQIDGGAHPGRHGQRELADGALPLSLPRRPERLAAPSASTARRSGAQRAFDQPAWQRAPAAARPRAAPASRRSRTCRHTAGPPPPPAQGGALSVGISKCKPRRSQIR